MLGGPQTGVPTGRVLWRKLGQTDHATSTGRRFRRSAHILGRMGGVMSVCGQDPGQLVEAIVVGRTAVRRVARAVAAMIRS